MDAVKEMAESEILSRAADGTFVRDLLYGATGIPVPRAAETGGWDWRDRARLIEDGWVASGGWGGQRYLDSSRALSPATGELILNSTSVKHNCRVWISQIQLGEPGGDLTESFDPEKNCDKNPGPGPRTIDLFRAYGPYVDRPRGVLPRDDLRGHRGPAHRPVPLRDAEWHGRSLPRPRGQARPADQALLAGHPAGRRRLHRELRAGHDHRSVRAVAGAGPGEQPAGLRCRWPQAGRWSCRSSSI